MPEENPSYSKDIEYITLLVYTYN